MVIFCFLVFVLGTSVVRFCTSVVRLYPPHQGNKGNLPSKRGESALPSCGNEKYYRVITRVRVIYPAKVG